MVIRCRWASAKAFDLHSAVHEQARFNAIELGCQKEPHERNRNQMAFLQKRATEDSSSASELCLGKGCRIVNFGNLERDAYPRQELSQASHSWRRFRPPRFVVEPLAAMGSALASEPQCEAAAPAPKVEVGRVAKVAPVVTPFNHPDAHELNGMRAAAKQTYDALPRDGKEIWKAMSTTISNTLSAGVVHFESKLKNELGIQIGDCQLDRQAGSQWVLRFGSSWNPYYVSVRAEVLGSSGSELLSELKRKAKTVKSTLLDHGAQWLRDLTKSHSTKANFLKAVQERERSSSKGKGKGHKGKTPHSDCSDEDEDEVCHICWKSIRRDLLGGKHMCRIVVQFTCCGKWTSHSGRYNVEEGRVMGQRCQRCGHYGQPSKKWSFAKEHIAVDGEDSKKAHREDLCEACERYGNCRGAFFDPFQMAMAVQAYTGRPAQWSRYQGSDLWITEVDRQIVVLRPHVFLSGRKVA